MFAGEALAWTEGANFDSGEVALDIPAGAFLDCTVSYEGVAQHFWFLFDPSKVQNPRRAAYQVADKNVELLKKIIAEAVRKGDEARDFEAAIAWLFWMLGFSVVQLGHTKRSNQAAADVILTSPSGNFAVVECTTGLLKADQKLSLLHQRAQSVRRSLDDMQFNHLHVLPVIVTSKPRAEVEPDIEQAEKLSVLVLAREAIDELLNRTLTLPNADQLYNEALQVVQAAEAICTRHSLPGSGISIGRNRAGTPPFLASSSGQAKRASGSRQVESGRFRLLSWLGATRPSKFDEGVLFSWMVGWSSMTQWRKSRPSRTRKTPAARRVLRNASPCNPPIVQRKAQNPATIVNSRLLWPAPITR